MLGLFKKKKSIIDSGLLLNFTDIHSHILYGIDDGVKEKDEALCALKELETLGVRKIYFTPHIMSELIMNIPEYLNERFNELKSAYKGGIDLRLAAEYMLDNNFEIHLKNERNKILAISEKYILVETSYMNPPLDMNRLFDKIREKGYYIILAHPERYLYMDNDYFLKLKSNDSVFFQLNLLSLTGYYGNIAQKKSRFILENDLYSFVGMDIHNLNSHIREFNHKTLTDKQIEKIIRLKENNNFLFR